MEDGSNQTVTTNTVDLSQKKIKKLIKFTAEVQQNTTNLVLDDNELTRLENIDGFVRLQKLSVVGNQLLRMHGVGRLHSLQYLNLSKNNIITIEGLRDLLNLKWVCLAENKIKSIEHLHTNSLLEYLDLSHNQITYVADLTALKNLKDLYLHNNKINHLRQCERFLPTSLVTLTISANNIDDLNEVSQLVHLINLTSLSIANNPCVNNNNTKSNISNKNPFRGFDYRPFVKNWCLNVKIIDGFSIDDIESLKAEWLYSQGKGRQFRLGDQSELVQYLISVCPLNSRAPETEEDKKLRLILSKAQHHQQQLREQSNNDSMSTPISSPLSRKRLHSNRGSPRSRMSSTRQQMSTSCHSNLTSASSLTARELSSATSLMSKSLDATSLQRHFSRDNDLTPINTPLQALSKMVPVPENLMSPDNYQPPSILTSHSHKTQSSANNCTANNKNKPKNAATTKNHKATLNTSIMRKGRQLYTAASSNSSSTNSLKSQNLVKTRDTKSSNSEEDSDVNLSKLHKIQQRIRERNTDEPKPVKKHQIPNETFSISSGEDRTEQAAICIQKYWRGYSIRNCNKQVQVVYKMMQAQRAHQHIQQLTNDMQITKTALENERKIQMLQTEAISTLWRQMLSLQPTTCHLTSDGRIDTASDSLEVVKNLTQTCGVLQSEIEQLRNSVQDIMKVMQLFSTNRPVQMNFDGAATQTEITAVHTPHDDYEKFPFYNTERTIIRPTSLALTSTNDAENASKIDDDEIVVTDDNVAVVCKSTTDVILEKEQHEELDENLQSVVVGN